MTTVTRYVSHNPHEADDPGLCFPSYEDLCARIEVLTEAMNRIADVTERWTDSLVSQVNEIARAALNPEGK